MTTQNLWDAAKGVLRGKFTAMQSYLKTLNRQPNFTPKTTGKRRRRRRRRTTTTTKRISRKKDIIKIQAEIKQKINERNNSKD